MRLREWNYEEGLFTYAQRIAVGEALLTEDSDYQKLKACWRVLYGWSARLMPLRMRIRRFRRMIKGLNYWCELEKNTLKYTPTEEQKRAGIDRLFQEVGYMGTIKSLAEQFGLDPDTVLQWEWSKVYGILLADLKENDYRDRLMDNITRSHGH